MCICPEVLYKMQMYAKLKQAIKNGDLNEVKKIMIEMGIHEMTSMWGFPVVVR